MAAYRKAKGHAWMWLLLFALGVGICIAIGSQVPKDASAWVFIAMSLPILLAMIAAAVWQAKVDKDRRAGLCSVLQTLGMTALVDPTEEEKDIFFREVAHLVRNAGLRDGAVNLKWIAHGLVAERVALAFEHEFVTGTGRYTQVHTATCVAWVSNHGWLTLIRPRVGEGRRLEKSHPEIRVSDAVFDKDWIIWGEREAAEKVLTSRFRESLGDSPRGEMWCIGGGWTCCIFKCPMDSANFLKFFERSGRIVFQKP